MNTTSSNISSALLAAPYQLNMWLGLFMWMAGNTSCIGNLIVYSSRTYRKRTYGVYLLSESVSNIIYFDFLLLTRVLQKGFQIPITTRYNFICKLRQFDSVWNHAVSLYLFSFATIDQILSLQRSNTYRQWSGRIQLAYKMCIVCPLFWLLFFGHRLILYNITNGTCAPQAGFYSYFDNYVEVSFTAMGTPIMVIALAFLLFRSVRRVTQRKIHPTNNTSSVVTANQLGLQQIDRQIILMLALQLAVAIITRVPYAVQLIYTNITQIGQSQHYKLLSKMSLLSWVICCLTHFLFLVFTYRLSQAVLSVNN